MTMYKPQNCFLALVLFGLCFADAWAQRIVYENGDIYEGDLLEGLRHGIGVYSWSNGDV